MFGLFGKKKSVQPPPPEALPPPAPGWEAIEKAFGALYPGPPPRWWEHHGVHCIHDLNDPPENPLEAVAIYDAGAFWHYVSFGLSDLFGLKPAGDGSGFGYELTFRLAKGDGADAPPWPVNILVSLAKAAYCGAQFVAGHTVKVGPIDGREETALTALLTVADPALPSLDTPQGKVAFLLLLGVEGSVREQALAEGIDSVLANISARDPNLITRL